MSERPTYRTIAPGVETLPPGLALPRHRHAQGYATVVLRGRFVEASFAGRFYVQPGDVLLHDAFDCHANDARCPSRVQILRLPWSSGRASEGRFTVRDPETLARLAARDPLEAEEALREMLGAPLGADARDWPERLAADLAGAGELCLGEWARRHALAPETVSRGFRQAFGVTPRTFRIEARARQAWRRLVASPISLTTLAHELCFADLAHMSRSVSALTGFAPSTWRSDASGALLADLGRTEAARPLRAEARRAKAPTRHRAR